MEVLVALLISFGILTSDDANLMSSREVQELYQDSVASGDVGIEGEHAFITWEQEDK